MTVRERVHGLVETLPEGDLVLVEVLAERMLRGLGVSEVDPVVAALAAAPDDDEPYTEEEQREDAEAIAAYRRGEFVTHEEVMRGAREPRR